MWSINNIQTYVINLDRRPDRWDSLRAEPDFPNFPNIQRFSATDGKTLDLQTDSRISVYAKHNIAKFTRRSHDMLDSIGGVGCALSHIGLWEKLVGSDQDVFLILEDDILLPRRTWERVTFVYESTPELHDSRNWDIWSIGNLNCFPDNIQRNIEESIQPSSDTPEWVECHQFIGLQAYFISRRGADKLLKNVFPIQQHIDWFISYYAATHPFKVIHNRYINIAQRGEGSDIAKQKKCAICDIPTNVQDTHYIISKQTTDLAFIGLTSLILIGILFHKYK